MYNKHHNRGGNAAQINAVWLHCKEGSACMKGMRHHTLYTMGMGNWDWEIGNWALIIDTTH